MSLGRLRRNCFLIRSSLVPNNKLFKKEVIKMLERYIEMLLQTEADEAIVYKAIEKYLDEENSHATNEK